MSKGYKTYVKGNKATVRYVARMGKKTGKFKSYRIVKDGLLYELYVKK